MYFFKQLQQCGCFCGYNYFREMPDWGSFFFTSNLFRLDGKQQQLFPELKSKTAEELDYRIWQVSCE